MNELPLEELIRRSEILVEALPFIQKFSGTIVTIKIGGNALVNEATRSNIAKDIVLMRLVGIRPVVVHGGGPEISAVMKRMGIEPKFHEGLRVTDAETRDVAEMVLAGKMNGDLVNLINHNGGNAVGLSGKDGGLIKARKLEHPETAEGKAMDLGFVGEVVEVRANVIEALEKSDFIPVISPIGVDENGETYNINADAAAGDIACALKARKLIIITDVRGIMRDMKDESTLISTLPEHEIDKLIADRIIAGGMIPKVKACLKALKSGVEKTHILDGRINHCLLLELLTQKGIGTQIVHS